MKQYRFTSTDYVPAGDSTVPDAVMDITEINDIRRLAGLSLLTEYQRPDPVNVNSPVGSNTQSDFSHTDFAKGEGANISKTAMEKRKIEHDKDICPGTDEWFQLWFSKPYLTGEKPTND